MAVVQTKSTKPAQANKKKSPVNFFHQRLASLTYSQACGLLGENGGRLMLEGAKNFDIDFDRDVYLSSDLLRVRVGDVMAPDGMAVTTITLHSARTRQLLLNCNVCETTCCHLGAAFDYLLDSKSSLGFASPPDETVPLEHLTRKELAQRVLADRQKRAMEEAMKVRSSHPDIPWTDYVVTSARSGRTYRVAVRGFATGQCYCSCPDFRTNQIETCKHILHVQGKLKKRFSLKVLETPYRRKRISLSVRYGNTPGLQFNLPSKIDAKIEEIVGDSARVPSQDATAFMNKITTLDQAGYGITVFPDAEAMIQRKLVQKRLMDECSLIRKDPAKHPLRQELLSATLMPYQLDGIAFCVGAGRAILADDMGLGKTIQSIGVAELLARLAGIQRVLIICPASLKSQWRSEIQRFSQRSVQVVLGSGCDRAQQYRSDCFFTICNYEQVVRDLTPVEETPWDLVILDEGQRIKNWESKTSNCIRTLESPFRLVLSGTPLENRLGELFTVVRFVDDQLLGPAYDFFHKHHVVDDRGRTLGYRRLDELRETLKPIMLRRTRKEVAKQLPERTDEVIRIEPTAEQAEMSLSQMSLAAQIIAKKYMTEMDLLRLQKALLMARMACDSTFLIDQQEPEYSSKLDRLHELLEGLLVDPSRKIVIFSEWRRMLDRIERRLEQLGTLWVRLDGEVPQRRRGEIINKFQNDPDCKVILMTNAGSTGLNLQSANTVINVDLPWNPAILEQRIARAYRMGQKRPVHIYKLVTTGGTIEEQMLDKLAAKQGLADAALNIDSDISEVQMSSGMEDLKRRLEVILEPKPPAPVDASQQQRVLAETEQLNAERRERVSHASGQLISAALALAGELIPASNKTVDPSQVELLTQKLSECVNVDGQGRPQLTITLPDQSALQGLAQTLAKLLA